MGMTVAEKILARASGRASVKPGDIVEPEVSLAMSHENAALVINQFLEIYRDTGREAKVWDSSRIAIIFDHRVPAESSKTATNQKKIREFVAAQGIGKFHDIRGDRGGICHQVLPENGYVLPGAVVVGTDSHTTTHGAMGAFAFGIGATEMASIWTLGKALNIEVPATIRIEVKGEFREYVSAKDLILHIIGRLTAEGANFKVLEFCGSAIESLSMCGRLVLANMSVEAGATAGIVPADTITLEYLRKAGVNGHIEPVVPDKDAAYERSLEIDLAELDYQIACPHTVDNVKSIGEAEGVPVQQIVLGSCTNGRLEDIGVAASIIAGREVAAGTRMLVFPASWKIYREAAEAGYLMALSRAGAVIMNPGCGCCLGVHQGALGDGEVALSTTNRNFQGRMGNSKASVHLCSPAVAAACAITGKITRPEWRS